MRLVKEYICDERTPSDVEIKECMQVAAHENCIVKLMWFFPYNGWNHILIDSDMTFEDCKARIPRRYGV